MGAGTSPADRAAAAADGPAADQAGGAAGVPAGGAAETPADGAADAPAQASADGASTAQDGAAVSAESDEGGSVGQDGGASAEPGDGASAESGDGQDGGRTGSHLAPGSAAAPVAGRSRTSLTQDTARPEGGGRAAGGDAPAPARQWPLLAVLCTAGVGLLIVASDPFAEAFRIGTILIGVALVGGAVLRLVIPSVGMLAVRSRFTDLVTYGLLGVLIVMLAMMAQPKPWLDIPFLENAVHFTIR
ncbi:DUF3017 domain-containing protein [Streptomyces sp. NPDC058221]|uniref:DUF3017 domain-containing protein n=1 Tax=Streptomyces sp. NPDC058221 TaxID=3346388 RepID=UPI0036E7EED8